MALTRPQYDAWERAVSRLVGHPVSQLAESLFPLG
jgi:hypothetical protein